MIRVNINWPRSSTFHLQLETAIPTSGVTALYGPSGSGKSTLLRLLAGLEAPQETLAADIRFDDEIWHNHQAYLPTEQRAIGFVFQQPALFPHMTVDQNLSYAHQHRHSEQAVAPEELNTWFDLDRLRGQYPATLSGGEAQRVAIARVLANGARCLLMDEPLSAVDVSARQRILDHLSGLYARFGVPIVYVSHAFDEIAAIADHLLVLEKGKLAQAGSMTEVSQSLAFNRHPDETAAVVTCRVRSQIPEDRLTELDLSGASLLVPEIKVGDGQKVRVKLSARDVSIALSRPEGSSILNIIPATIVELENAGHGMVLIKLQVSDSYFLSRITQRSLRTLGLTPGQQVYAQIKSAALLREEPEPLPEERMPS